MANKKQGVQSQMFEASAKVEDVRYYYDCLSHRYDEEFLIHVSCPDLSWPCALSTLNTFLEVVGESNANIKILDLGAGTGAVGLLLSKHGYTNIDAIDVSEKMLDKAKEKNVYKNYICEAVTDRRLNIPTGTYDAIISCGVITSGYVKSNAFDEIVRLVRPGGHVCFTIRKDVYDGEEYDYRKKFEELEDKGKWLELRNYVDQYIHDSQNPAEIQKTCRILCYQVLRNE